MGIFISRGDFRPSWWNHSTILLKCILKSVPQGSTWKEFLLVEGIFQGNLVKQYATSTKRWNRNLPLKRQLVDQFSLVGLKFRALLVKPYNMFTNKYLLKSILWGASNLAIILVLYLPLYKMMRGSYFLTSKLAKLSSEWVKFWPKFLRIGRKLRYKSWLFSFLPKKSDFFLKMRLYIEHYFDFFAQ